MNEEADAVSFVFLFLFDDRNSKWLDTYTANFKVVFLINCLFKNMQATDSMA